MIKRFMIATGAILLPAAITATILFTKPWDNLQSWRFFLTQPVVGWRADIFTNWGVIQPLAELNASSKPRVFERDLNSPDAVSYSLDGKSIPLSDYFYDVLNSESIPLSIVPKSNCYRPNTACFIVTKCTGNVI